MVTTTLPVRKVLVLEDRAQVERSGTITLAAGEREVEITGLSLLAVDRSLEVAAQGATVIDARLHRRWRRKPKGGLFEDASALRREVDALARTLVEREDALERVRMRLASLAIARADVLRDIGESAGAGGEGRERWSQQLDALDAAAREADERMLVARRAHRDTEQALHQARAALATAETPEADRECLLRLSLQGEGPVTLRVRYQVACAAWRPAYRARLRGGTVELEHEAVVWQRTGEDWDDVELSLSTARPTLGTTPPQLVEDRLRTRAKQQIEKQAVEVAIREVTIATTGAGAGDELPGLDDGGEARLLPVPGRAGVPSDGQPHRVPLGGFVAEAEVETRCAPELGPQACVVARFVNGAGRPLLAGPVDVLRDAGYVGRTELGFVAAGERVELAFGSEDGVAIAREVELTRDVSRLSGKQTQRTLVTLYASNATPVAKTVIVHERLLVSEVKEVEVELLPKQCDPAPRGVDRDGIARIELVLPPGGTRTATFAWELVAAGKVAGLT
ncbi:MAG: mucoidy inhibitor MuiA family protein [Nannocystaceae bacterium]|nr:mucoidy inhibitor MuiA family protein [Nannocystaceae bacterium]